MDQFKIRSIGSNQGCAVRARREGYQDVEVEISEFLRGESVVEVHFREDPSGFEPIRFGWSEDSVFFFKRVDQCRLGLSQSSAPELGEHSRR